MACMSLSDNSALQYPDVSDRPSQEGAQGAVMVTARSVGDWRLAIVRAVLAVSGEMSSINFLRICR